MGEVSKRTLELDTIDDVRNLKKITAYAGILKNVKVPKSLITIPNTYLDIDLGDLKDFATKTKSNIAINARFDIDPPGLYYFTYKVFDVPSFLLLDTKVAEVEVRNDGPNQAYCPYKIEKLCKPYIDFIGTNGTVRVKLPFAIRRDPIEEVIIDQEAENDGLY